ncbi:MAG: methyltransferase domain-containing protein [Candidatus Thorarchaeota archaeon]|nr:MAG: methyltransferase domain-containing protein [Candidatus Thorarchaeota archaeon]
MAVAYMERLERFPETYDEAFDEVLEGRGNQIRERILDMIRPGMRVLDLGCGPGLLAMEAAKKGATVFGVDANPRMIGLAKIRSASMEKPPNFLQGDILTLGEEIDRIDINTVDASDLHQQKFDLVVSTFLLSELKPAHRSVFMHIVKTMLRDDGFFAVASETLPASRSDRKEFWRNRKEVEVESGKRLLPPVTDLESLATSVGLVVDSSDKFGSEITFIVGRKNDSEVSSVFRTRSRAYLGARARARIWIDHTTGGWRGIPIEPGLYKIGEPTPESPVIVTANYELTYYTVMRALDKDQIDAWVMVCDTNGINVWCAARGVHFDSEDVIHMIRLTGLSEIVSHRELILPQLAAAGMDPTMIHRRSGFRVRYGPVRIQDLSRWFELEKPRPKPRDMATITFNFRERMEQTVAHIPFLFAVLLWKPMFAILGILTLVNVGLFVGLPSAFATLYPTTMAILLLIGEFLLALFGNAIVLGVVFPVLPSKGNSFWRRGIGLAAITMPLAAAIMLLIGVHWTEFVVWEAAQFVMVTSLTMDWSGMTTVSDPKVIRREYPYMILTLKIGAAFIIGFNILVALMGW